MQQTSLPLIVDIKRHSLEDGPGIRSVVFFKGCSLRCIFCHNPEAQDPRVEIAFSERKCIGCGKCSDSCPEGAINVLSQKRIDRDKCVRCGNCTLVCPGNALRLVGCYYSAEALTEILLRDLSFYRHSGGGVTLSGGECTIYPDYLKSLLRRLKSNGIHVVLETSGYFAYDVFRQKVLPYIDLIYYDIKIANPTAHARYTGRSNKRIFENFRRLLREKKVDVLPRIPFIPGITSTRENLLAIVDFLCEAGARSVCLLPYNPLGIDKYVSLGRARPPLSQEFVKPDEERQTYSMLKTIIEEKSNRGPVLEFAEM